MLPMNWIINWIGGQEMNSVDRLVEYYNALIEGDWPTLVNCFDLPSKVISLYGVVNFECKEQIQNVYESVLDTWR